MIALSRDMGHGFEKSTHLLFEDLEELEEEAASIEDLLDGMEFVLGPALDRMVFPGGVPNAVSPTERVRTLLADIVGEDARVVSELLFPFGIPANVDAASVLRATRDVAARERAALRRALEQRAPEARTCAIESAFRLVRLWALSTECHTVAAQGVDMRAALLMDAMASRWFVLAECFHSETAA
jgi:hypothetical protein